MDDLQSLPMKQCFNGSIVNSSVNGAMGQSSIVPRLPHYPLFPVYVSHYPAYFSASAFRAQSCSINCCALARTRSSLSSKARINGSTAPGGADRAQVSRARSRTRTFGELSFWAIHSGTTGPSTGCPGSEDRTGTAWGLSPPGTGPFPDTAPISFPEARGTELAAWVTGVNGSLRGEGPGLERVDPPTLARDSRLGALSDETGPQPVSPTSNEQPAATSQQRRANSQALRSLGSSLLAIRFTGNRWRDEFTSIAE
jgi:hypothetical protein